MKKYGSFAAGVVSMLLAVSLVGAASAASGQVAYNRAGISLFGQDKVLAGESYTAPNGQQVPAVITYIDEAGGMTNYLSVRQVSELLGIEVGWDGPKNRVNIGSDPSDYTGVGGKEGDGSIPENPAKPVLGTVQVRSRRSTPGRWPGKP